MSMSWQHFSKMWGPVWSRYLLQFLHDERVKPQARRYNHTMSGEPHDVAPVSGLQRFVRLHRNDATQRAAVNDFLHLLVE